MEAFARQDCQAAILRENSMLLLYCCDSHYDVRVTIPSLPYIKLHGTCCHFSFINNPRRNCVIPISKALPVSSIYISGVRTSVIRPMRKVKPRRRPLTSNSSEGRKQFLYHFPQLIPVFSNGPYH